MAWKKENEWMDTMSPVPMILNGEGEEVEMESIQKAKNNTF